MAEEKKVVIEGTDKTDRLKISKPGSLTEWVLCAVNLFVIIGYAFYIFTGNNFVNSDSAGDTLFAAEIVRTGQWIPTGWNFGQDLWSFSVYSVIAVLLRFSDNYIFCRTAAYLIFGAFQICSCIYMSKKCFDNKMWLIAVPLIFSGITHGFVATIFGLHTYVVAIIYMFLSIALFSSGINEKLEIVSPKKLIVLFLLIVLMGIQGLRFIQAVDIPLIGAAVLMFVIKNNKLSLKKNKMLINTVVLVMVIGIAAAIGYLIFHILIGTLDREFIKGATAAVITEDGVGDRLINLINCFFELFDIRHGVGLFSAVGLISLVKYASCALFLIIFPILQVRKFNSESNSVQLFMLYTAVHIGIIAVISVFTDTLSEDSVRYLFTSAILLMCLSAHYIYKYILKNIDLFNAVFLICIGFTVLTDSAGMAMFYKTAFKEGNQNVIEYLRRNDLKQGYATYWNAGVNTFFSNGDINVNGVIVGDMILPYYWANSSYWYTDEAYEGNSFLLLTKDENDIFTASSAYDILGDAIRTEQIDGYYIYVYDYNIAHDEFRGKSRIVVYNSDVLAASEGCRRSDEGITVPSGAIQYGPYASISSGTYKITISGNNLQNSDFDVWDTEIGAIDTENESVSAQTVSFMIRLAQDCEKIEFRNFNSGSDDITINSVEVEKLVQ